MNITVRRYIFIFAVLLFGVFFSIMLWRTLPYEDLDVIGTLSLAPLTPDEIQDALLIKDRVVPWAERTKFLRVQSDGWFAVPFVCFYLMLLVINSALGFRILKTRTGLFKTLAVTGLLGAAVALTGLLFKAGMPGYVMIPLFLGLVWTLAGHEGWAGNLDSWKSGTDRRGLLRSFFNGLVFGISFISMFYYFRWSLRNYHFLVRQVFGGNGEDMTCHGWGLMMVGLLFLCVLTGMLLSGLVIVLSPVQMEKKNRMRWAIYPAVSALVLLGVLGAVYVNGAVKYDLGKKDIIEASGLSTELPEPGTLITLRPPEQEDVPWTVADERAIEIGPYLRKAGDVPVTMENVRRLDEFIRSRPEGSVYLSSAKSARAEILFALWQVEEGTKFLRDASSDMIWPRMLLAHRLKYAQVNERNKELLDWLMDESWSNSRGWKLSYMEVALVRMGKLEEAQAHINSLRKEGLRDDGFEVPKAPPVSDGIISGRVIVQGSQLSEDAAIALMSLISPYEDIDKSSMQWYMAMVKLVAVIPLGPERIFRFADLGEGGYFLVVKDKSSAIPVDNERVSVINSPGVLVINSTAPSIDVGEVVIQVN